MNSKLKYICIEGRITSRGEYITESMEYRPYEAVTIIDNDGDEVHFSMLSISKRMDDLITLGEKCRMYILRFKHKNKLYGVLFAAEVSDRKHFYPETAIPALKALALKSRRRYPFISDSSAAGGSVLFLGGILGTAFSFGLDIKWIPSFITGLLVVGIWMYMPMILSSKNAGIKEMRQLLKADGFDLSTKTSSSKY